VKFWQTLFGSWGVGRLANPDRGLQLSGDQSRHTEADITVTDERAMAVSVVWGCARIIAQSGGTLPLDLYRKDKNGDKEPLEPAHPLRRVLQRSPNGYMNPKEFRQAMWLQRVLWGNAFARITYNSQGQVVALTPMKAEHVNVVKEDNGIRYEHDSETGDRVMHNRFGQRPEVFHWRGFSPDGVIGLSPLAHARHTLGISVAAERFSSKAFSGRPMGVIQTDREVTAEQQKRLRALYGNVENSSAVNGDGKWWLMPPGFRYQSIGIPPDDLQMLSSRQFQVQDICRFFGVPAVMMDGGQGGGASWPASYEKQKLAFMTFTLQPLLEELEDKIMGTLAHDDDEIHAAHNLDGFLRADSITRSQFYASMLQNGVMSRNEIRKMEGLPKSDQEGADKLTVQLNMTALEDLPDIDEVQEDTPNA